MKMIRIRRETAFKFKLNAEQFFLTWLAVIWTSMARARNGKL